jgi:alkanesulfonate monooxygenase SsuD/methylene tetrahydromethanopterin reductase-like flavin-dependent oxidoreductase (luciferase family)
MDIGLMHVTPNSKADPAIIARHAEELGFESYWVGDHTIVPPPSGL